MAKGLKKKKELVEEIGVYFEKTHQIPPLAARIYALLILCPKAGHSFDDIVALSSSSKSSVSTNLNLLLERGGIEYFTKSGERKRYFRLSKSYLEVHLKKDKKRVSKELTVLRKINRFNKCHNTKKFKKHQEVGEVYKAYLEAHRENLDSTINKMNKLEQTV